MSRQLENLKRVFGKLQSRYGADDALVSQFKQEVDSRESTESDFQQLTAASYRPSDMHQRHAPATCTNDMHHCRHPPAPVRPTPGRV